MNRELRDRWVAALRSGDYKQGKYFLKQTDFKDNVSHCCLGVLCEVFGAHQETVASDRTSIKTVTYFGTNKKADNSVCVLVPSLLGALGLPVYVAGPLSIKNDTGKTFDEIADAIERMLEVEG